jgi:D-glycero-alpha-D-manno-heptose 1-phosphate guanylyltransferase
LKIPNPEQQQQSSTVQAIILAGGAGSRLSSVLKNVPKSMAPVGGRPFLEWLLLDLASQGFKKLILSVGVFHEQIIEHFQAEFAGMDLYYAIEDQPLGTGGAIRRSQALTSEERFFVINGDTLVRLDYREMVRQHELNTRACGGRSVTLALVHQPEIGRYGRVLLEENEIVSFQEKKQTGPGWINAGVYLLEQCFPWPLDVGPSFSFEREVLGPHARALRPGIFRSSDYFLDIGVPEDLKRAQIEFGGLRDDT